MRAQRYIAMYFPFVQLLVDWPAHWCWSLALGGCDNGAQRRRADRVFALPGPVFSPIQQLSQVFDGYQQATVGLRRIGDLLRTPTSTPPAEHPRPRRAAARRGRVPRVHFR